MRSGVLRLKMVPALCGRSDDVVIRAAVFSEGAYVPIAIACTSSRADTGGRADSRTGHASKVLAEMVVVSPVDSWLGQCGALAVAGSRQLASHQARTGAAVATAATASTMSRRRNIDFSIAF